MSEGRNSFSRSGADGRMTEDELREFLDQPLICRLSCLDDSGWPYCVPVWFEWDGKGFWIVPREKSVWARYIEGDPRVALCIDEPESGMRVTCQGEVDVIEKPNTGGRWVEYAERMTSRYRGESGRSYFEATLDQPRWLFYVRPKSLATWKGGGWHEKYAR